MFSLIEKQQQKYQQIVQEESAIIHNTNTVESIDHTMNDQSRNYHWSRITNTNQQSSSLAKSVLTLRKEKEKERGKSQPCAKDQFRSQTEKICFQDTDNSNLDFGFIKSKEFFGNSKEDGIFNSRFYFQNLSEYVREDELNQESTSTSRPKQKRSRSILDKMQSYVSSSSEIKKKYLMQMMNTSSLQSHQKYLENEQNEQSILNKLNTHIQEVNNREKYLQLANASYFKRGDNDSEQQEQEQQLQQQKQKEQQQKEIQKKAQKKIQKSLNSSPIKTRKRNQQTEEEDEQIKPVEEQVVLPKISAEKQLMLSNKKAMKSRVENIFNKHNKTISAINFAFSDVTEQIKEDEILKKIQKLTQKINEQNEQGIQSNASKEQFTSQLDSFPSQIFPPLNYLNFDKSQSGIGQFTYNSQDQRTHYLFKDQNSLPTEKSALNIFPEITKAQSHLVQEKNVSVVTQNLDGGGGRPASKGEKLTKIEKLELQKKALIENSSKVADQDRLYFQERLVREKNELMVDISRQNNREKVLDRVMMSYFHQQDLLNKKKYSKKEREEKDELNKILSSMQPKHLRLQLKNISRQKTSNKIRLINSQDRYSAGKYSLHSQSVELRESNDEDNNSNMDVDIYKEQFQWKKMQNKSVNYAKICSPAKMVLSIMKQSPLHKKQQNIEAIDFLISLDLQKPMLSDAIGQEQKISLEKKRQEEVILRRCFFWNSNKNDIITSQRYQEINYQNFLHLFSSLSNIPVDESSSNPSQTNTDSQTESQQTEYQSEESEDPSKKVQNLPKIHKQTSIIFEANNNIGLTVEMIQDIFNKVTKKKEKKVLNYYDFLQALHKVSVQYYLTTIQKNDLTKPSQLFQRFMDSVILPKHLSFRDQLEIELINMRSYKQIDSLLTLFEEGLKELFILVGQPQVNQSLPIESILLGFQELFELVESLGFFPTKISKLIIKYFFHYSQTFDQGLCFNDFCQFFHLLGLHMIRNSSKQQKLMASTFNNLKKECRQIQFSMFKMNQENNLNEETRKFIIDISLFYVHSDYIHFSHIQEKIKQIKGAVQKQAHQPSV